MSSSTFNETLCSKNNICGNDFFLLGKKLAPIFFLETSYLAKVVCCLYQLSSRGFSIIKSSTGHKEKIKNHNKKIKTLSVHDFMLFCHFRFIKSLFSLIFTASRCFEAKFHIQSDENAFLKQKVSYNKIVPCLKF